nr:MAG TPA: adenine-specific methyltransferase [Bacteriophage sp.]
MEIIRRQRLKGGSRNPIVFHDYESYIAKFQNKEKTTDDTYTPQDIYEAVSDYVRSIYPMEGKEILRPFYPGGDYEHAEYPEDGVVIDNPPFSMFSKICKFYSERRIPFFLFGPGLTIFSCLKYCSAVVIAPQIEFSNGAKVKCNFATNLIGDVLVTISHELSEAIAACPSQNQKVNLPKFRYPQELLSVSDFQTMAKGNLPFSVNRDEAVIVSNLDNHPKKGGLYGSHLLISEAAAVKAAAVKAAAVKAAAVKAAAAKAIPITLSDREQAIVDNL